MHEKVLRVPSTDGMHEISLVVLWALLSFVWVDGEFE